VNKKIPGHKFPTTDKRTEEEISESQNNIQYCGFKKMGMMKLQLRTTNEFIPTHREVPN
jgi:hypothetical protein